MSTAASGFPAFLRRFDLPEPGELRLVARVYVWARWFVWALATFAWLYPLNVAEVVYPPNVALALLLLASNGCLHYRLATKGTLSWRWMLAPSALDLALLSAGVAAHRGFETPFFVGYYPCLAMFAVVVGSVRLALAWVTMTAVVYTALCLAVEPGLDVSGNDEEILLIRVAGMYLVAVVVNLISRVERIRRMEAVARERALQRERIELSHAIHDTTAQSAFMIGLGIDAVQRLVGDSNAEVKTRLDATAKLSKTAIWQLRHPIDVGRIFDGRGLGRTLESHVSTFTQITSVQADLAQHGVEPPLSVEARNRLFAMAHNALTNAFRHAEASRVLVELAFGEDLLRLSVSDDGIGLPVDYADRGHGFANMRADAERLGGCLRVEPRGSTGGASVTCMMPLARHRTEA